MNTSFEEKATLQLDSIAKSIEKLATKDEISRLATKDEMSKLATKDEISRLATKDDLNSAIDDLAGTVKKGFDEVHGKFAKVDERFDALGSKVDRIDTKFTNQLDYFHLWYPTRKEFAELDGRIKKVEKRLKV